MEGLREVAIAHYEAGSKHVQDLAHDFFNAMDRDGDRQISFPEFMEFTRQLDGYADIENRYFFEKLDRDGNGRLDFMEVMTLFYVVKSRRPFCNCCRVFVTGVYFTCVDCFESPRGRTYCLCLNCYPKREDWNHSHNGTRHFLDNYTLLEFKRSVSAMNQAPIAQTSNAQQTSNALVLVQQGNKNSQWKIAFKAFETALAMGSIGTSVASLCTIL